MAVYWPNFFFNLTPPLSVIKGRKTKSACNGSRLLGDSIGVFKTAAAAAVAASNVE